MNYLVKEPDSHSCKQKLQIAIQHKAYSILSVTITCTYAAFTFVSLVVDGTISPYCLGTKGKPEQIYLEAIMLGFVGLFVLESIIHCLAFGKTYLRFVNLIETATLLAAVAFNVWGIIIPVQGESNLPGVQRLIMVIVLICKIQQAEQRVYAQHCKQINRQICDAVELQPQIPHIVKALKGVAIMIDPRSKQAAIMNSCITQLEIRGLDLFNDESYEESDSEESFLEAAPESNRKSQSSIGSWYKQFSKQPRLRKLTSLQVDEPTPLSASMRSIQTFSRGLTLKLVTSMLQLNEQAKQELLLCDQASFNIFKLRAASNGRELEAVLLYILAQRQLFGSTLVDINRLANFAAAIQNGYQNVPYHNKTHGADLTQTINMFLTQGGLGEKLKLDPYEYLAVLTAASVHDFEHPGVNNIFLQKIQDPIAIKHNDISVLENHHIAAAFELMLSNPNNNWACRLESTDFLRVRQLMIDCVLATDMSFHFRELKHAKERTAMPDYSLDNEKDKLMVIKLSFHLADISNPVKPWDLCKLWTDLLYVEFFVQGDLERQHNFPISNLFDRYTTNIAKSQIGFVEFIIKPSYQLLLKICPELEFMLETLENNKTLWTGLFDEYEGKMQMGNFYMKEIIETDSLPGANIFKKRKPKK